MIGLRLKLGLHNLNFFIYLFSSHYLYHYDNQVVLKEGSRNQLVLSS